MSFCAKVFLLSLCLSPHIAPSFTLSPRRVPHSIATALTTTSLSTRMFSSDQGGNDESKTMHHQNSDDTLRSILTQTRTIAMLGASNKPQRDSYHVMEFLMHQCGYTVIPINPMYAQQKILGQPVYASLSDLYQDQPNIQIDMIDIFRRSSEVKEIVQEILQIQEEELTSKIRFVWMQIGVVDHDSALLAAHHGLQVAMDVCPLHEIPRLGIPLPIHSLPPH